MQISTQGNYLAWLFSLKIAAKRLQMDTWLLLTVYMKSPMVASPIPYDLLISHNTARLAYH